MWRSCLRSARLGPLGRRDDPVAVSEDDGYRAPNGRLTPLSAADRGSPLETPSPAADDARFPDSPRSWYASSYPGHAVEDG